MEGPIADVDLPPPASPNPDPPTLSSDFNSFSIPLDPYVFSSSHGGSCCFDSDLPVPLPLDADFDLDMILDDVNVDDLFFNTDQSEESGGGCAYDSGTVSLPESGVSGDPASEVEGYLNCSISGSGSCDSNVLESSSSPAVSQGSRNDGMSVLSPESGNFVVEEKVKVEEDCLENESSKRKNEVFENINGGFQSKKSRKSSNANLNMSADNLSSPVGISVCEGDDKRKARLIRNRESAQLSRQRKKHYVEELEEKVRAMHSTISDLNCKISYFMTENASLKQQLSGNGMCPAPVYPPHVASPIPYPWVPCPPYVVKSQGSQVPLVPIPRLKPQQQPSSSKKSSEGDKNKSKNRSKKVASMAVLSMLSICLFFGGYLDHGNLKGGGVIYSPGRLHGEHRGRILISNNAGYSNESYSNVNQIHCERGSHECLKHEYEKTVGRKSSPTDEYTPRSNGSEPLFASLFVPRNDKLVKIDGNLIIHSVLASDKAIAFHDNLNVNRSKDNGVLISKGFSPSLALPDSSSQRPQLQTTGADSKIQQWFREGLAEPMLSSGMCTEVYQFNVAPSAGVIVPSSAPINITSEGRIKTSEAKRRINRRALHGLPLPKFNLTGQSVQSNLQNTHKMDRNKSASTVVSVLIDPRETGEIEVDGIIRSKSLSRIFVVVLLDSVKYVTYSCKLPHVGPHLVTT